MSQPEDSKPTQDKGKGKEAVDNPDNGVKKPTKDKDGNVIKDDDKVLPQGESTCHHGRPTDLH